MVLLHTEGLVRPPHIGGTPVMKMAHHVASRWLTGATEEEPDTKTKGPPPHWDEYLKDEWEGGKQKVPNSNTKSKNIHPNVSMSTLFKTDKAFQTDVYKKYHEWLDKGKKPKAPGKQTTPSPKNAPKELGLTRKDWEAWSNREAATQKSWSKDERKALNFYTADGYEEINGKLRGQRKSIDDKAIEAMAHLEALFSDPKRSKIKKGVVASRGVDPEHPLAKLLAEGNLKVGTVMEDPGYTSTSVIPWSSRRDPAWDFECKLKISVPKGAKGVFVGPPEGPSRYPNEWELLLDKGAKMRVTAFDKTTGIIELEIIK